MASARPAPDPLAPAVIARDLDLTYGQGLVVKSVSLEVAAGETVAILGPSGGGKSTFLKAVAGLLSPAAGSLEVLGSAAPSRPPSGQVGYVPQRLGLVRHASALANVLHGALPGLPAWRSLVGAYPEEVRERARQALADVGLAEKAEAPIHQLSGGQQRRVAVARALVQRPRLLLADEFLGELDPATVEAVWGAVRRLQQETGMTLLVVEHHLDQALRLADRIFSLKEGHLTAMAVPEDP
ncbi:MAG: phosphonate ABC transporter ATP-binding protein [Thermoplasmatota archaeon]